MANIDNAENSSVIAIIIRQVWFYDMVNKIVKGLLIFSLSVKHIW